MKIKRNNAHDFDLIALGLKKGQEAIAAEFCTHSGKPCGAFEYCSAEELYTAEEALTRIRKELGQ